MSNVSETKIKGGELKPCVSLNLLLVYEVPWEKSLLSSISPFVRCFCFIVSHCFTIYAEGIIVLFVISELKSRMALGLYLENLAIKSVVAEPFYDPPILGPPVDSSLRLEEVPSLSEESWSSFSFSFSYLSTARIIFDSTRPNSFQGGQLI
jgi:hypothetical protein